MYQDKNYHDFVKMSHSSTQGNTVPTVIQMSELQIIERVAIKVDENLYCFITLIAEDISDDASTMVSIQDIEDLVPVIFWNEDLGHVSTQKVAMEIGESQLQCVHILTGQSVIHPETNQSFKIMKPRNQGISPYYITLYQDYSDVDILKTSLTTIKIEVLAVFGFVAL